jgi:hypothetical protein
MGNYVRYIAKLLLLCMLFVLLRPVFSVAQEIREIPDFSFVDMKGKTYNSNNIKQKQ